MRFAAVLSLILLLAAPARADLASDARAAGGLTHEMVIEYRAALFSPEASAYQDPVLELTGAQTVDGWWSLVAIWWPPDQVGRALDVIRCESGGDPGAHNLHSSATGLFQILGGWADTFGFPRAWLEDPETNVKTAYRIWKIQGWGAWNASRSCWGG